LFPALSAVVTGFSWLCNYRALPLRKISQAAPVDKLREALGLLKGTLFWGEAGQPKGFAGRIFGRCGILGFSHSIKNIGHIAHHF
jgi:uncharacterized membrane protein